MSTEALVGPPPGASAADVDEMVLDSVDVRPPSPLVPPSSSSSSSQMDADAEGDADEPQPTTASTTTGADAPTAATAATTAASAAKTLPHTHLNSPPHSNNAANEDSDSELSDLGDLLLDDDDAAGGDTTTLPKAGAAKVEEEDDYDIGEVVPDHWTPTVPVFRPTMEQFKDFSKFVGSGSPASWLAICRQHPVLLQTEPH